MKKKSFSAFVILIPRVFLCLKMARGKDKRRENVSVASEIDRLEERRTRCHDNLEKALFKSRKGSLSEEERQQLEKEMSTMNERVQNLDEELRRLRAQNRTNALLSAAVMAACAVFYYILVYDGHGRLL
ncbi:coiled-coil domain-containing protein 167 [Syngnathoides biaculeatus]|uniref:coiled-coil domain-containing protein 167 n=1 Tax=Syngnathoides biaculeatus TaxID=300417 RepID=UPI002ADE3D6A|nr:coiled-coil domain-containing protein 167 [Syngnathoides biaculeatus]